MQEKRIKTPNGDISVVHSDEPILVDGPTALDFAVNAGTSLIAVNKEAVGEDFFRLSSGVAGEVAQKLVNYRTRLAIIGDFSHYESKPLRDFIIESNRGRNLYFVASEEEAIQKLSQ
jgi:hypothetical protein